jgi:hypothetical protein
MQIKKLVPITREWDIEGFPNHFFSSDNRLFRLTKKGEIKENKLMLIGYTKGFVLMSKFHSLTKLAGMKKKHEDQG